jgi:hypothetical protein
MRKIRSTAAPAQPIRPENASVRGTPSDKEDVNRMLDAVRKRFTKDPEGALAKAAAETLSQWISKDMDSKTRKKAA